MSELDLDAIERRAAESTPPPWVAISTRDDDYLRWGDVTDGGVPGARTVICEHAGSDAGFIAHAREDVPALIAEVRRLRSLIATTRQDVTP